jgi:hypothetical protein
MMFLLSAWTFPREWAVPPPNFPGRNSWAPDDECAVFADDPIIALDQD